MQKKEPKFELFADRLEITSAGMLPPGFNEEDFPLGYSVPQNKELMRVFKDLDLVEHINRVVKVFKILAERYRNRRRKYYGSSIAGFNEF